MNSDPTAKRLAQVPASIAAQYETLRSAAMGEPLPVEARRGLGLFLRRGMWGWVRALAVAGEPAQPTGLPRSESAPPHLHRAVIQILATMALNSNHRRAQ